MPEEPRFGDDFDGLSTPRPEPDPGTGPEPAPGRWCLLRHDLPNGSWHLDLMILTADPSRDPDRPLVTLRLPAATSPPPPDPACRAFHAQRIGDHRAVYLDYEGPVSGGRGSVTRLASGTRGEYRSGGQGGSPALEIVLEGARYRAAGAATKGLTRFARMP